MRHEHGLRGLGQGMASGGGGGRTAEWTGAGRQWRLRLGQESLGSTERTERVFAGSRTIARAKPGHAGTSRIAHLVHAGRALELGRIPQSQNNRGPVKDTCQDRQTTASARQG